MRPVLLSLAALGTLAHTASGGACEDRFSKAGNAFTGSKFSSTVTIADLSPADAIGQLHGIAVQRKLDILTEDAANGSMLLEDRASFRHKAIPYVISATREGDAVVLQLLVKLDKGAIAKADDARTEICGILSAVMGGDAGRAAAAAGSQVTADSAPRKVDALVLSLELAREAQASAESIPLRYKNRSFTVSGRVDYVIKDGAVYRVAFAIPEPNDMAIKPGPRDPHFKIDISCLMAPSQTAWAIALRAGEKVKLTGAYEQFDQFKKVMWLGGCRAEP